MVKSASIMKKIQFLSWYMFMLPKIPSIIQSHKQLCLIDFSIYIWMIEMWKYLLCFSIDSVEG